jgi:hypothetical protein
MNCDEAGALSAAELVGELSDAERPAYAAHLSGCENCRLEAERLRGVWRELGDMPPVALSDVARARLRGRLRASLAREAGATRGRRRWPLGAAALLLAFGLGALSHRAWRAGRSVPESAPSDERPRYLLLLTERPHPPTPPDERDALAGQYGNWSTLLREQGGLACGAALEHRGVVLTAAGETPYVPGETQPAGFVLINAANDREAVELARASPHLGLGGTIIVLPVDTVGATR